MLPIRHFVAIACCAVLTAADAGAFQFGIHVEITQEALAKFVADLAKVQNPKTPTPPYWREMLARGFTSEARLELTNANKAKDTGNCADKNDADAPAVPCTPELASALIELSNQFPQDHFDAEKIQEGSDQIFELTETIRRHLLARRFVAARKVLGGVLHGIQDFYAHTNWVDLNNQTLENRLGAKPNAFTGTSPRIATAEEPMCQDGARLLTTLTPAERQEFLQQFVVLDPNPGRDPRRDLDNDVKLKNAERILLNVFVDKPLTSGYFSKLDNTLPEVENGFKCRHGYNLTPGLDNTGFQPGVAKDVRTRTVDIAFDNARALALLHSSVFIGRLFSDSRFQPELATYILGLMGYESRIRSFEISQVPGPPPGQTMWDDLFDVFSIFRLHPDIEACVSVAGTGRICAEECKDTEVANLSTPCRQPLGLRGLWLPASGSIGVEVWDNDPTSRQLMARGEIPVSDACLANIPGRLQPPCKIETPRGPLVIKFDIPGDMPATAGSAPPPPPAAGNAGAAPSAPPAALALLRTPEAIDAALRLRDADQCVGADTFFPSGDTLAGSAVGRRLGAEQTNRLYQAAALTMVVGDATAKQNLMAAIQPKVDSGDWLDVMTSLLTNPQQAQAIVAASQGTAKYFAGQVAATGLDQLLQPARPVAAIEPDVNRWIAKRLASAPLASEAVDRILSGTQPLSAECTLNQLAKDGFTDTVNGR